MRNHCFFCNVALPPNPGMSDLNVFFVKKGTRDPKPQDAIYGFHLNEIAVKLVNACSDIGENDFKEANEIRERDKKEERLRELMQKREQGMVEFNYIKQRVASDAFVPISLKTIDELELAEEEDYDLAALFGGVLRDYCNFSQRREKKSVKGTTPREAVAEASTTEKVIGVGA